MAKKNCLRKGCKDVFNAFLLKNARFAGELEIPCVKAEKSLPTRLVSFSKAVGKADHGAWVHFYEDDVGIERFWRQPQRYLPILKRYAGVISPDYSLYRDMPLVFQQWNVFRNYSLAHWLQENDVPVIANVRWGDERTYALSCISAPKNATIAIGSHGCVKLNREREFFIRGLEYVVNELSPTTIIVYGSAPDVVFEKYRKTGIRVLPFKSDCMIAHNKEGRE